MTTHLKIDFVSDVSCPWCVIGLRGLEEGLARAADAVDAEIVFRPFELNPAMVPEGQDLDDHIAEKYGSTKAQSAANRLMIRDRAAELGFTMSTANGRRIYNSFDAHRLLHWAAQQGRQKALKQALFKLYFTDDGDPSDHDALIATAEAVGLDPDEARAILSSDRYAEAVRTEERLWQSRGIKAVPAVVVNERYLISGGQPPAAFEEALRAIAKEMAAA
ncbi:DsbA family oxidoreductase [Sphingomonas sp.]|uniref:DsbA family oxidoreductase n=1 Tax=Sphingomonas sp. TaxID=28214 RepID=UPI003B3BE761